MSSLFSRLDWRVTFDPNQQSNDGHSKLSNQFELAKFAMPFSPAAWEGGYSMEWTTGMTVDPKIALKIKW